MDNTVKTIHPEGENDLKEHIEDVRKLINAYFNNGDVYEALIKKHDHSMYHSFGYTFILYEKAVITKNPVHVEALDQSLKMLKATLKANRIKQGKIKIFTADCNKSSPVEIHAEVIYPGYLAIKCFTMLLKSTSNVVIAKAFFKIKKCADQITKCKEISANYVWKDTQLKDAFDSIFKLASGLHDVVIGSLPKQIKMFIGLAGYKGNKQVGLDTLRQASQMQAVGSLPCYFILLIYETFYHHYMILTDPDTDTAEKDVQSFGLTRPNSFITLGLMGLVEEMKGNIDLSETWFQKGLQLCRQNDSSFCSLFDIEMISINIIKQKYSTALEYIETLSKINYWSPVGNLYITALLQQADGASKAQVDEIIKKAQVEASPSIMLLFIQSKIKKYNEQNGYLCLPLIELLYYTNKFSCIRLSDKYRDSILNEIDAEIGKLSDNGPYAVDNKCTALLLKAAILLKHQPETSEQLLKQILTLEKKLKDDKQIIPFTYVELSHLEMLRANYDIALKHLKTAKKHSDYFFDYKLLPLMHAMKDEIKRQIKK